MYCPYDDGHMITKKAAQRRLSLARGLFCLFLEGFDDG